jgi:hypothetical protein
MLIRGAAGRKLPHGRVQAGDRLYFMQNNGEGMVRAWGMVSNAIHSEKLEAAESERMVAEHQALLALTPAQVKRWAGKRFLVLIAVEAVRPLAPFAIDRGGYGNMDDWLPVGDIDSVRLPAQAEQPQ